ncbi:MAG: hypothetical protein WA459_25065 [Stellaceae bacterium]
MTLGDNTPLADLMVISPVDKTQFLVDVKGLARRNYWTVAKKEVRQNLFYILALVPSGGQNLFFILPQVDVNQFVDAEFARCRPEQREAGIDKLRLGVRWQDADQERYREAWKTLPQ